MRRLLTFWDELRGSAAAEFALVLPGFLFLSLGAINLSVLMFAATSLHQATESAARYASVQTTVGGTAPTVSAVSTYAKSVYTGPGIGVAFTCPPNTTTCAASGCGHTVTGTGSYRLFSGVGGITVPLSATACFP